MTVDDEAVERLVEAAQGRRSGGIRVAVRPLPRAGLPLRCRPRRPPERRGGPGAARLRQGPGGDPALRIAGRPLRGLAVPAGQECRHRPRPDPPGARHRSTSPRSGRAPTTDRTSWRPSARSWTASRGAAPAHAGPARGDRAAVLRGTVREGGGGWRWTGRKAPFEVSSSGPSRRSAGTWASSPTPTRSGPGLGDGPGERGPDDRHWNRARARSSSGRSNATDASGWIPARPSPGVPARP